MKKLFPILLLIFSTQTLSAQVFWTEDFSTSTWSLNQSFGTNAADSNFFKVSDGEGGGIAPDLGAPASCGVAGNSNNTLHITNTLVSTAGATYNSGGFCSLTNICVLTALRAESPTINATGKSNIVVDFNYIENGDGTLDNACLWYYDGVNWLLADDMPKTLIGCGAQGLWTSRTVLLPAAANNNPNLKIGFTWENNDDGIGTDPSFAVDDIQVSTANNSITTLPLNGGNSYCACDSVLVQFQSTGTFSTGNTYAVQLSDALGSFALPVSTLAVMTSTNNSGNFFTTIPCSIPTGSMYRIRVVSTNPIINGSNNGSDISINASVLPQVSISANPGISICENDAVTFTAAATNPGTSPSYIWRLNGTIVGSNSTTYANSTLQNNDMVHVELNSSETCANNPAKDSVNMIIYPNVAPTVSMSASPMPVMISVPTTYTAIIPASITNYQLNWYRGGVLATTTNSPMNTYTLTPSSLNDSVRVEIVPVGCFNPAIAGSNLITLEYPSAVGHLELSNIEIYPNPTHSKVQFSELQEGDKLVLINNIGQSLHSWIASGPNSELDLSEYSTGLYFISISRDEKYRKIKLLKN